MKSQSRVVMATTVHPHDDVRIYHKEAKALARAGAEVIIVNLSFEGQDSEGTTFVKAGEKPTRRISRMTRGTRDVLKAVVALKPQVCHIHDPELLSIVPALKRQGIKVVYDSHEKLRDQMISKEWIPKVLRVAGSRVCGAVEDVLCRQCDGIIAATEEIARSLAGGIVVKNLPTDYDYCHINEMLGAELPQPQACYIGSITEQRGIISIIKAAYIAGISLKLAGIFESEELYQRVIRMKEWETVCYEGMLDRREVAKLIARSSVGLLMLEPTPSYQYSLPIKLYEYLAGGLWVVASDFAYWRSLGLSDQISFVPPDDIPAISQAMKSALKAVYECDNRADRAQKFQAKHSFATEEQKLLALYDSLLS